MLSIVVVLCNQALKRQNVTRWGGCEILKWSHQVLHILRAALCTTGAPHACRGCGQHMHQDLVVCCNRTGAALTLLLLLFSHSLLVQIKYDCLWSCKWGGGSFHTKSLEVPALSLFLLFLLYWEGQVFPRSGWWWLLSRRTETLKLTWSLPVSEEVKSK